MAKRPTATKQPAELSSELIQAGVARLTKVLEAVRAFDPTSIREQFNIPQVEKLTASIDDALVRTFGADTLEYDRYRHAAEFNNGPFNYAYDVPIHEVHQSLARSKDSNIALLEQAIDGLNERLAEMPALVAPEERHRRPQTPPSNKVFVVHGRDNDTKNEVARFLSKIGLEEIILHERPNKGRHLLTKFQEEADGAGFAVVLITPDDQGGLAGEPPRGRARQNVVFELGFFIGKLGPSNVAALVKGDVEKPSDFDGVGYIPLDAAGAWKGLLARELKAANVPLLTKCLRLSHA
jgi:predicted nucleotide-binding protein